MEQGATPKMTVERRDAMVARLARTSRRERQELSAELLAMARTDAGMLCDVTPQLIEALEFPEAQTRWQCLDALAEVARVNAELVADAFDGAEEALFDEHSALVRVAAFRFLARYGATSPERSQESWPLMHEAIQCYHGNLEYRDMLVSLLEFSHGTLADEIRGSLGDRMVFDAKNGEGLIRRYSADIRAAVGGE